MSFLTDIERENLKISEMILHVVGQEDFSPQPKLSVQHASFFTERILETDVAPVYKFKQKSMCRDELECIAIKKASFQSHAQKLSYEFSRLHGKTAGDGAFFIFELHTSDPHVRIYSLVKYDYREALEQAASGHGVQRLRRIVHALIDDKKAIQKSALIRVCNGNAQAMIAAVDRSRPAPEIADYFATFLDVDRDRNDEDLNKAVVEALRKTLQDSKTILPGNNVAQALRNAKDTLRNRQVIDDGAVIDAVLAAAGHPSDEETCAQLKRRTAQKLRSCKLTGLAFPPDRNVLRKAPVRRLRTTEGVTITYPDEANAVTVQRQRNPSGEGETITIKTNRVVEDTVVPDHAR